MLDRRPYTEEQVFQVELRADDFARRLYSSIYSLHADFDEETLAAILYDGMLALREDMAEEADDV